MSADIYIAPLLSPVHNCCCSLWSDNADNDPGVGVCDLRQSSSLELTIPPPDHQSQKYFLWSDDSSSGHKKWWAQLHQTWVIRVSHEDNDSEVGACEHCYESSAEPGGSTHSSSDNAMMTMIMMSESLTWTLLLQPGPVSSGRVWWPLTSVMSSLTHPLPSLTNNRNMCTD